MQRGARSIINVIDRFWACAEKRSHHIDKATSENEKELVLFHTMRSCPHYAEEKQKKKHKFYSVKLRLLTVAFIFGHCFLSQIKIFPNFCQVVW